MTARLPDSSLALLREGYTFISARYDEAGTDLFQTRLMLRPVVCIRGAAAAEFFYGGGRFSRTGALPRSAKHLLQDAKSVQPLKGQSITAASNCSWKWATAIQSNDSGRLLTLHGTTHTAACHRTTVLPCTARYGGSSPPPPAAGPVFPPIPPPFAGAAGSWA
ncbi:hypothetical protein LFT45_22395 (plasmid) [Arthrobacter sp. FW305-BF8]|uniref:hypothetical protein n=1 Tax=Arthrobacter sp. FW305-BF8 TaxID=2879617 RepID=UPI001F1A9489|nr:hypothetical protein [Arthrobacter sp. FW305-BF8]UKA56632.1 hypothetical protein LFT45_22395 [Arthrobacter sp. FW305-BF8]